MDKARAIEVLKSNRPTSATFALLGEAVDVAIAAIEESLVQKPPHNNAMAAIAKALYEHISLSHGGHVQEDTMKDLYNVWQLHHGATVV